MLATMVATGLRVGELIGLTWDDIDLKTKKIHVDHQLIYKNIGDGKKYDFHIHRPKTNSGVRDIDISEECIVSRIISAEGKNSARINGMPVPV